MKTVSVSEEVKAILAESTITANSVRLPDRQLPRPLYVAVNKVLEAADGKWSHKDKAHLFTRDPRELLGMAVKTGKAVNIQQALQAFYTPATTALNMACSAGVVKGSRVLEPSAGEGALADAARIFGATTVDCYDIDEHSVRILSAKNHHAFRADFLKIDPPDQASAGYDAVVMNPPFTRGQDVAHVSHALKFLKPGGRLVAIMSAGFTRRGGSTKAGRELFQKLTAIGTIFEPLPSGIFGQSGTDVATVMVIVMTQK